MSTWNIEQEKDRDKEKVGGRPAKLNEKKKQRRHFLLEGQHENFVAQVTNFPRETFFPLNQEKKPLRMIWTILKQNKPEKPYK